MTKALLPFLFLFFSAVVYAQPDNYWTLGSNTESSIMAGAVVGGGSGITSIFYNPAGISEIKSNKISMDASLFQFDNYNYENTFSKDDINSYLDWQVKPRFFSFVYQPKNDKLKFQVAVFSRSHSFVKLKYFDNQDVVEPVTNINKAYSVQSEYEKRYSDYWFGLGSSYELTDKLVIGVSLLGSGKGFVYKENYNIDLVDFNDTLNSSNSIWSYSDRQDLYVVSIISKIGLHYTFSSWTFGATFTAPSIRLYGDGYHSRHVRMTNIFNNGILMPDIIISEQNNHIVTNFKEPLSVAVGFTHYNISNKTRFLFSAEYFAPIAKYKSIDNSRVASIYTDEYSPGSDFLTYYYESKSVFNIGFGFKHALKENLFILTGFKTDFSSNDLEFFSNKNKNLYKISTANLYHFSLGVQFKYKSSTALLGTEYTTGSVKDIYQFSNYSYPGVYSAENYIALQEYPQPKMNLYINKVGLYIGLSLNF